MKAPGFVRRIIRPFRRARLREFPPKELRAIENEMREAKTTLNTFEKKLAQYQNGSADHQATQGQIEFWQKKIASLRNAHKALFDELLSR